MMAIWSAITHVCNKWHLMYPIQLWCIWVIAGKCPLVIAVSDLNWMFESLHMPSTGTVMIFRGGNTDRYARSSIRWKHAGRRRSWVCYYILWTEVCADRGLHHTRGPDAYPRAEWRECKPSRAKVDRFKTTRTTCLCLHEVLAHAFLNRHPRRMQMLAPYQPSVITFL